MDPAIIIATVSLVSTLAMAFVSRSSQRSDKVTEDVTILKTEVASLKAEGTHMRELLGDLKVDIHEISQKLDKIAEKQ